MKEPSKVRKIPFVGDHLPRKCGIATFTTDLLGAVAGAYPQSQCLCVSVNDSFVMKDLKKYKDLPSFMHKNRHLFDLYPKLMSQATQSWFRVDGTDKLSKEREIIGAFRKQRGFAGLLGDAFKMMRVWR